jgi:hypothetical protein
VSTRAGLARSSATMLMRSGRRSTREALRKSLDVVKEERVER